MGRFFKIHLLGRRLHFRFNLLEHLTALTIQKIARITDSLNVVLAGDSANAGGGAVFDDMVVAVFVIGFPWLNWPTRTQAKSLLNRL